MTQDVFVVKHPDGAMDVYRQLQLGVDDSLDMAAAEAKPSPARYSREVLEAMAYMIGVHKRPRPMWIHDPFAGEGNIHDLPIERDGVTITASEIEPEFANNRPGMVDIVDAAYLHGYYGEKVFDVIATSVVFPNRMCDSHDAHDGWKGYTYKHSIGRDLHGNNLGQYGWNTYHGRETYRRIHWAAWDSIIKSLKWGGIIVLDCKNHLGTFNHSFAENDPWFELVMNHPEHPEDRGTYRVNSTEWHCSVLAELGMSHMGVKLVGARGMRNGANRDIRESYHSINVFRK